MNARRWHHFALISFITAASMVTTARAQAPAPQSAVAPPGVNLGKTTIEVVHNGGGSVQVAVRGITAFESPDPEERVRLVTVTRGDRRIAYLVIATPDAKISKPLAMSDMPLASLSPGLGKNAMGGIDLPAVSRLRVDAQLAAKDCKRKDYLAVLIELDRALAAHEEYVAALESAIDYLRSKVHVEPDADKVRKNLNEALDASGKLNVLVGRESIDLTMDYLAVIEARGSAKADLAQLDKLKQQLAPWDDKCDQAKPDDGGLKLPERFRKRVAAAPETTPPAQPSRELAGSAPGTASPGPLRAGTPETARTATIMLDRPGKGQLADRNNTLIFAPVPERPVAADVVIAPRWEVTPGKNFTLEWPMNRFEDNQIFKVSLTSGSWNDAPDWLQTAAHSYVAKAVVTLDNGRTIELDDSAAKARVEKDGVKVTGNVGPLGQSLAFDVPAGARFVTRIELWLEDSKSRKAYTWEMGK